MKNTFLGFSIAILLSTLFISCEKQNIVESIEVKPMLVRSNEYFANLRAYKKSKHQVFFGWFGGTGIPGDPNIAGVFDNIPDSVDIVSLWGGYPPPGSYNAQTLQKNRTEKGTRFVWCMFGSGVSKLMKKNTPDLVPADKSKWNKDDVFKAIDLVAKAMADTIAKHNLDGFDLDYEPGEAAEVIEVFGADPFGSDAGGKISVQYLFKALSKYMGPQSGTRNLLIIDGYNEKGTAPYIDYLVQQAYYSSSQANLQSRYMNFGFSGALPPEKFIPAEDFEKNWKTGGVNFADPILGTIPSLIGFARWNPTQGQKGGAGAYHAEYEYSSTPDFKYVRQAIQIMNPAVK